VPTQFQTRSIKPPKPLHDFPRVSLSNFFVGNHSPVGPGTAFILPARDCRRGSSPAQAEARVLHGHRLRRRDRAGLEASVRHSGKAAKTQVRRCNAGLLHKVPSFPPAIRSVRVGTLNGSFAPARVLAPTRGQAEAAADPPLMWSPELRTRSTFCGNADRFQPSDAPRTRITPNRSKL